MKKEIYIIKNDINNKVYVGQAINSKTRFKHHQYDGKNFPGKSLIDDAIFEFGQEHFWYEVIEESEDYNEREKYWINYYNCLVPNGYNQTLGGSGLEYGIYSIRATIKDEKVLKDILNDICNSKLKLIEIANKYHLSLKTISAINRGTAYYNAENKYPLRSRYNDKLNEDINDLIAYDLMYTSESSRELSQKYQVSTFYIGEINYGKRKNSIINEYPIRKKDTSEIELIRFLLINSSKSFRKIAEEIGVSYSKVQTINSGRYHFDEKFQYPLRKQKQYNICFYS